MAVPRQDVRLTGPQQLRVEIELSDGTAQTLAAVAQEIDDPDGPAAIDLELSLVEAVLAGFVRAEDGEGEVEPPKVVVTATSTVAGRLARRSRHRWSTASSSASTGGRYGFSPTRSRCLRCPASSPGQ